MRLPKIEITLSIAIAEKLARLFKSEAMQASCQHAKANKQNSFLLYRISFN